MKILNILELNVKKLKARPKKASFLIVPVIILIALSVVISSQVHNINNALKSGIFETISDQYTLLSVKTEEEKMDPSSMFRNMSSFEQNKFSQVDVENVKNIEGVSGASLEYSIPIQNIKTSDLFEGKEISFSNVSTLDEKTAQLYTAKEFTYKEANAIPIVLNASSFTYSYEDWSGGDTLTIEMGNLGDMQNREPGEMGNRISVVKTEAVEYSKEDLLGKTFTISFGGLDDIQDYTTSMDRETRQMVITKLTDEEYDAKVGERRENISEYWDYDSISAPLTYTFVVAGVIESESSRVSYIPEDFANILMSNLVSLEINSRIVDIIPSDVLNSDFMGLTYDGDELSSGIGSMIGQMGMRMGNMGGDRPEGNMALGMDFAAINIPGLVISVDSDSTVEGTLDDESVYSSSNKYSDTLNIVLNSVSDRTEVIEKLNSAGYAYQDLGDLDVFENLESTLEKVSNIFLVSFITLVGSIVILTMGKLISESIKEIGIFRAIGMRREDILKMFISQSILYVFIGYILGILSGVILNSILSPLINMWFGSFIDNTVSKSFSVINTVDGIVFYNIDMNSILIYSLLLFVISLVVSIIPSLSASKISPVEAIKGE